MQILLGSEVMLSIQPVVIAASVVGESVRVQITWLSDPGQVSVNYYFRGSEKGTVAGGKAELFYPFPIGKRELHMSKEHGKNCQNKEWKSKPNSSSFPASPELTLPAWDRRAG